MGGKERLTLLKNWFKELQQQQISIEIVSLGNTHDIVNTMWLLDLLPYIDRIHGSGLESVILQNTDYDKPIYYGNNVTRLVWTNGQKTNYEDSTYIYKHKWVKSMLDKNIDVLFVDDSPDNYERLPERNTFINETDFYHLQHNGEGLTSTMMKHITEILTQFHGKKKKLDNNKEKELDVSNNKEKEVDDNNKEKDVSNKEKKDIAWKLKQVKYGRSGGGKVYISLYIYEVR